MKPILLALVLGLPALAAGDEVFLRSGGKVSGQVVSEDGGSVVLDVGPGRVAVPASSVLRIERGRTPLILYRERAARLAPDDAQGWLALGLWAQERDLVTRAREAFERVLQLDPDNAAANAALGRVQLEGRWMRLEDAYRERGYVHYEGEWMTPAEQEARVRARAAETEAEAARREAALRVREAEARARQAEAEARRAEADAAAASQAWMPGWWGWGWGWGWGGTTIVFPPLHEAHAKHDRFPQARHRPTRPLPDRPGPEAPRRTTRTAALPPPPRN
jgi:hypothetical protein